MKPNTILIAAVCTLCVNLMAEEAKSLSQTGENFEKKNADKDLIQFLIDENKALRNIIANATDRKAFLVYDNGSIQRIEINDDMSEKLSNNLQPYNDNLERISRLREIALELKIQLDSIENPNADTLKLSKEAETLVKQEINDISNHYELYSRQLKDLEDLRQKVLKLQGELMASRKLEWIRRGLYGQAREGGGAKLMSLSKRQQSAPVNDDLTVEIRKDGTVKIAPSKELALKKELKAYVEKLIEDFNTADPVKYKSYFHIPHAKVSTTQVEWMDDVNSPLVNFEKLRDTGWVKSTVNEIEVIYATEDKGLVRLNFSRINKDEEVIVTTDAVYTFTKINGKWGISVLFVGAKDLPLN